MVLSILRQHVNTQTTVTFELKVLYVYHPVKNKPVYLYVIPGEYRIFNNNEYTDVLNFALFKS